MFSKIHFNIVGKGDGHKTEQKSSFIKNVSISVQNPLMLLTLAHKKQYSTVLSIRASQHNIALW
jgi:hypothetical protein